MEFSDKLGLLPRINARHCPLSPSLLPTPRHCTPPNVNDVKIGRQLALERGATYVFDKGYCDYNWWHQHAQKYQSVNEIAALYTLKK